MFSVGKWPWELIICHLDDLENEFGEDDEAMFQSVECPYELISFNLCIQESDLHEFAEVNF
jgi:hypothetical protein